MAEDSRKPSEIPLREKAWWPQSEWVRQTERAAQKGGNMGDEGLWDWLKPWHGLHLHCYSMEGRERHWWIIPYRNRLFGSFVQAYHEDESISERDAAEGLRCQAIKTMNRIVWWRRPFARWLDPKLS